MGGKQVVYGGVLVRNVHGNLYLDMELATESEVADTEGSTATTMGSHPAHKNICGALHELCTDTIINLKAQLEKKKQLDEAEATQILEAKKAKEAARLATKEKI